MSSYQAGVTPVEALARPQAATSVAGPSPAVLRTALGAPVTATERSTATLRLAQYRPGTTQQVRPIPVPQATVNRGGGSYNYPQYQQQYQQYPSYPPYAGAYLPNSNVSIGATISKDGISIGLNRSNGSYINQPGGQATYHMVVYSQSYGYGDVRAGGIIPYDAIPQREYQWWNPGDWFLRQLG